jgi:hypothetical protein
MSIRYRRIMAIGWVLMVVCSYSVLGKQDVKTMKTIGILQMTPALDSSVEAFKQRLEWQGYHEGESVQYMYRNAYGSKAAIGDAAKILATLPVDLFFTLTTVATDGDHRAVISELFQAAQARQFVVKSATVKRPEEVMQAVTALVPLVDALIFRLTILSPRRWRLSFTQHWTQKFHGPD